MPHLSLGRAKGEFQMKMKPPVLRNGNQTWADRADSLNADSWNLFGERADAPAETGAGPQAAQAPNNGPVNVPAINVWINEIHYDNSGADTQEGVEIAGTAGTDLTGWTIVPYNGNTPGAAVPYTPIGTLSGTIPNQQNGFGTVYVSIVGLQNGPSDGLALVNGSGTVIQFLSYEGVITAAAGAPGGPAAGMTSTDVGVLQGGTQTDAFTMQLQGSGDEYADFTWASGVAATRGAVNTGQSFIGGPGLPTLSIDNVTLSEGDAGTVTFLFTVSLSAPAGPGGVTFDIATADGTAQDDNPATEDNDYVGISLTGQTIPAGSSTYAFSVTVNADNAPEANETFFVNVTNVTGATVGDGQGQGTINNDDTPGTLAINNVTLAEGSSGTTAFTFIVTRSGGSEGTVGATWTLNLPGGANADAADFDAGQSLTGSVSFADGDTSETITVQVQGDSLVEPDEGFTITLSSPTGGATIADDTGAGTITNDDSPPIASIADAAVAEGDDGVTYLVFTVTLDHASNGTVTFDYDTTAGSAIEGSDYLGSSGQVTFAPGETSETISIPLIGDDAPENNETFTVTLSNPSGGTIGDGTATGTITNDDGPTYFALAGGSFSQNWDNIGLITANDDWSLVPHIIGYRGDDLTNATGADPRTIFGTSAVVDVNANQTNPETFITGGVAEFHVSALVLNATVAVQGSGTADAPYLVLHMDATGRTGIRLQADLRDLDGSDDDAAQQINVQYRTSAAGAWVNAPGGYVADATDQDPGADLADKVTMLDVILPADANGAATLQIRIMTTNANGNDEWVGIDNIVVSSQAGAGGGTLSIDNAAVYEGDAGNTPISFTVTRAGGSTGVATADYTISFGSGNFDAGVDDFAVGQLLTGSVSFADGETTQTIVLNIDGDVGPEGDEDFTVTLSNASGAALADAAATGTIVNDDGPPPLVTVGDVSVTELDSGTSLMTFTVTRTGGTHAFSVDYDTADGTATAGQDYVATSGTLDFAVDEMSQTVSVTINGDTDPELSETLQLVLSNATSPALIGDDTGIGTILADDVVFIHQIQGTSYFSPIVAGEGISGFNVATTATFKIQAVVTAVDNDGARQGFYVQEQVTDWDGNSFTSEGIFVMTRDDGNVGSAVSGVAVGDLVTVTARVMEYQYAGFSSPNMPITAMVNPSWIVNSTGNSLPTLLLDAGRPIPNSIMTGVTPDYRDSSDGVGDSFDASLYGLSYWETVEGMLVTIPDMVVADGFVDLSGGRPFLQAYSAVHADADQINSRGGYTIAGDPPLSPPDTSDPEDGTTHGGRHLHDGDVNPDIIDVDFTGWAMAPPTGLTENATMGDSLGDVTGIIDFAFTDRKLFVTAMEPGGFVNGGIPVQETTALGNDGRSLTVGTFNVENLDFLDAQSRFDDIADAIANNLNAPDIISIEEIQDNNGAGAGDGANATGTDATQTWERLVAAVNAATGANYQWVDQAPDYDTEGGEDFGNIRVGFLYNTDRVQLGDLDAGATIAERRMYTDRIGDGTRDMGDLIAFSDDMVAGEINTADWSGTRRSLLGEFTFNGNVVYVTANHFPAKSGSGAFWQFDQNLESGDPDNSDWAQRNAVAQDVYAMLNHIETNATDVGIAAGGDFNDFYFYRPLEVLTGYVLADGTARAGGSRFDNLTVTELSEAERYTYTFDGRSQAIDHIVVNSRLSGVAGYDIVHLNTGYNRRGTGPDASPSLSDHDPALSSFDFREFSEILTGTSGSDSINGFGGNDMISGLAGDDFLDGGTGVDALAGGANDDTYFVDNAADTVTELSGEGRDVVYARVSYALAAGSEVEILSTIGLAETTAINLTGNELGNILYGNAGANILNGAGGADYMAGLGGDDDYHVDNAGDYVAENAGGGRDVVYASASYALAAGASVEVLSTIGLAETTAIDLTGNELANLILGNAGANVLNGGGGADYLAGLGGDDTYHVDNAGDYIAEDAGGGRDVVYASASYTLTAGESVEVLSTVGLGETTAIDLTGNGLGNLVIGNAGANVLNGGGGADYLVGLGGADSFAFTTALGGGNVDTLADFSAPDDIILLDDAVFAALAPGALGANAFVIGGAALDADDRIIYNNGTGQLFYDADGSGAGIMVQFATLNGAPPITAADFMVI
jgi:uncharacterized protein